MNKIACGLIAEHTVCDLKEALAGCNEWRLQKALSTAIDAILFLNFNLQNEACPIETLQKMLNPA